MFDTSQIRHSAVLIVVVSVLLFIFSVGAHAQRTMNRQSMVTLSAVSSMLRPLDMGAELCYGQYLLGGFWSVSAEAAMHKLVTSGDIKMDYLDMTFSGGYMHRLVSTRSRNLCLYAGGEAFLGFETYDPKNALPANINTGLPSGSFLYGITPQVVAELFLTGKLALVAGCSAPVNFSSPITKVRPSLMLGLRLNI